MKKVIYSKITRDRKRKFQTVVKIINENGVKYVLKSPLLSEAREHVLSLVDNYKKLNEAYGDVIKVAPCTLVDNNTVRFEYVEGKLFTEVIIDCINNNEIDKAMGLISRFFSIISDKSVPTFIPDKLFVEVLGDIDNNALSSVSPVSLDWNFNNVIIDNEEQFNLIDHEWVFDFYVPIKFLFYRSIMILSMRSAVPEEFIANLWKTYDIDENQINMLRHMDAVFLEYYRDIDLPQTLHRCTFLLDKGTVSHNLNWLDANNPKVFPDYGNGYSETTKKVCLDFDFRTGRLDTTVVFEKTPERIRFDPVDGLYCAVSDIKIAANGKELPITWQNGSDLNGVMLFDTIDSNIYYENPERARVFTITANIAAFNDEKFLSALKTAQRINIEHASLQQQFAELQVFERQTQRELTQTQELLTQTKDQLAQTCQQLDEANSEIQTLTSLKAAAEENAREMTATAEQWHASYEIITNSCFWKITYPFRKLLDVLKSIFRKKK